MEVKNYKFKEICIDKGFIRGPFGSALKKSLFVPKGQDTYKVYEQCVPLEQDKNKGDYYISGEYFRKELSRFEVRHNDFLVSCSGVNYGAIYHLKEPFEKGVINQALLIIRINEKIVDYNYFKYLFKVVLSRAITSGTGDSTIPNFPSLDLIKNLDVSLPDLDTQKRIGLILSQIDEKIDNNQIINNNLLQMIDTLYQEFVYSNRAKKSDFKAQNMFQNELFTLIKSGVKHFNTKTYYATSEVNGINISNGWTITYEDRESRANMTPSLFSVWFAKMKNSIKHLFLNSEMQEFINNSILSTGFYGLQCTELSFEYVASVIHNTNFEKLKDILSHGATQQGIGDDDLKNIKLLVPSEELLKDYHQKTAPLFSLIAKNINENNSLIGLRDYLLPLLMNGQVILD